MWTYEPNGLGNALSEQSTSIGRGLAAAENSQLPSGKDVEDRRVREGAKGLKTQEAATADASRPPWEAASSEEADARGAPGRRQSRADSCILARETLVRLQTAQPSEKALSS